MSTILFIQRVYTELLQGCNAMVIYAYVIFHSTIIYSVFTFWGGHSSECTEPIVWVISVRHCSSILQALNLRIRQDCAAYPFQSPHFGDSVFEIQRSDMIRDRVVRRAITPAHISLTSILSTLCSLTCQWHYRLVYWHCRRWPRPRISKQINLWLILPNNDPTVLRGISITKIISEIILWHYRMWLKSNS